VPVLLVCGDEDLYFPKEVYQETARLIPDCTLRMYEGAGHVGAIRDRRFPQDVLDFVGQRSRIHTDATDHIREELGASYSPFASVRIYDAPFPSAETYIEVTGDPSGLADLSVVLNDDLVDLAANGPTDTEYETALSTFRDEYQYFDNTTLAFLLANNHWRPTELDDFVARADILDGVSPTDFAEFVARALPSGQFIEILNLPA